MALDRNRELSVPNAYPPRLPGKASKPCTASSTRCWTGSVSAQRTWPGPGQVQFESIQGSAAIQEFFPTGTTVQAGVTADDAGTHLYGDSRNDTTPVRAGVTVTQALLRGASVRVNLATIRQAQLDVLSSQYQLRGFTETLAGQTEQGLHHLPAGPSNAANYRVGVAGRAGTTGRSRRADIFRQVGRVRTEPRPSQPSRNAKERPHQRPVDAGTSAACDCWFS